MMFGKACIDAAMSRFLKRMQDNIQRLQDIAQKHPEMIPLLGRLLTEHESVLWGAFGSSVEENSWGHVFNGDFDFDMDFFTTFLCMKIDDGSPGIGYTLRAKCIPPDTKEETSVSIFLRSKGHTSEPEYEKPVPYICYTTEFAPWIEYATIDRMIEVLDYHYKEHLVSWALYRAANLEGHTTPNTEQANRILLAKELGFVAPDFEYVMVDAESDREAARLRGR